ncbi:MAG: glycosyltransferase family 2 protein [Pirellulales bacterium]
MSLVGAAQIVFWFCVAQVVATGLVVAPFALWLARSRAAPPVDAKWPKAVVLLPLRGADANLGRTIERLLAQDYPDYEVHAVIDAPGDPAAAVVEPLAERNPRLKFGFIREKLPTCSPQCSALLQGVNELASDVEIVATIDGDVQTHSTWLRELVAPLLDAKVGAAFGNRWYLPSDAGWGSVVRYVWIASTIIPMALFRYPWAGTFAIKRRALIESGLIEHWPRSIVPDAPTSDYLHKLGLQTRFVPSLMMVNRERCGLAFCADFVKRQMTWTRLYNRKFWPVVVPTAAVMLAWFAWFGLSAAAIVRGNWAALGWTFAGIAVGFVGVVALVLMLEFAVRAVIIRRGAAALEFPSGFLLRLPAAIAVAEFMHAAALWLAYTRKQVTWRGVTYQIDDPRNVRIVADDTSAVRTTPAEADVSL